MTSTHPAADVLPLLVGEEFDALVLDIRANGLRDPIILHPDGSLLDGRNRERACARAGIAPRYETWGGEIGAEAAFVISVNIRRRHLDASQRAMLAARISNLDQGRKPANLPVIPVSQPEAAKIANVSERSVRHARLVIDRAGPELVAAVDRGEVSVSKAAEQVKEETPKRRAPMTRTPKLEAKVRMQRERARYSNALLAALGVIAEMPDPRDVIPGIAPSQRPAMEKKLATAQQWLTDFQTKWSEHDRSAA